MAGEHPLRRLQLWWASLVRRCPLAGWVTYPPLWLTLLGVLLVVAGQGQALGIPSLVWHDRWHVQLLAGLSLTVLCLHLGMVGFLLDSRDSEDTNGQEPEVGEVARYVVWPGLALLLACGIGLARQHDVRWHGAWVMVAPLGWFIIVVAFRDSTRKVSSLVPACLLRLSKGALETQRARVEWTGQQPPIDLAAHAVQLLWMALLIVFYVGVRVLFWFLPAGAPAVVAVALALALATGIWGVFSFWMRRYRAIGLAFVLLTAFILGVTRDDPPHAVDQVQLASCEVREPCLIQDGAALEQWRQQIGRPAPLVVVTTSGGASRAALWTITVLDALSRRIPGFMKHVRIVTGASGGMVGAAHYVSAMGPAGPAPLAKVRAGAAADSLSAVAGALILPMLDRGRALERAWESSSEQRMAMPFTALADGERAGWRPSLVFSPMMVEDGRRLIISNLELPKITETVTPSGMCVVENDQDCKPSVSAVQLFACGCADLKKLQLSTVARMNATFPWVTSAALLPSQPTRRVVDAGYYDNYGVNIAALWIRSNIDWLKANTSGVLVIQIRDSPSSKDRRNVHVPAGPGYFQQWVSALSTPIEAFLKAREASMSFRNDDELGLLAADPRLGVGQGFFKSALFEFAGEAPLSWYLSDAQVQALNEDPESDSLEQVARWWGPRSR